MNRFFNITSICSNELLPWRIEERKEPINHPLFQLVGKLRFESTIAGGVIVLPDGYLSDLASIPKPIQGFFLNNDDPRISGAAWVHDYICSQYDRKLHPPGKFLLECGTPVSLTHTQAARILAYEAMPELRATRFQQDAVYLAVNYFGPKF